MYSKYNTEIINNIWLLHLDITNVESSQKHSCLLEKICENQPRGKGIISFLYSLVWVN